MILKEDEFDSEFCNVIYMGEDNTVFLTWKRQLKYQKNNLLMIN